MTTVGTALARRSPFRLDTRTRRRLFRAVCSGEDWQSAGGSGGALMLNGGAASVVISKRDSVAPSGVVRHRDEPGGNHLSPGATPSGGDGHRTLPYDLHRVPAVTGTPKPPTTELDDLLISVKTTKSYHDTRLEMITKTWYQLAKEQIHELQGCFSEEAE
uniref:Fringe-like glycosyltransferase domain-containing protein n=1 Tax=Anopheles albimanus TaxID=7167 RepID=A0A182FFA8_ANOAL